MEPIPLRPSAESPLQMQRREFLKGLGAGALALPAIAGPFVRAARGATQQAAGAAPGAAGAGQVGDKNPDGLSPDHFVPLQKKLDRKWVEQLFAKGEPTIYSGSYRAACAMPVGGIGCGQLYVGGDGTLRTWEIFNRRGFSGWGQHNYETDYEKKKIERVVEHGFAVAVKRKDGSFKVKRLREEDFPDVTMKGEHPIAEFTYPASDGGDDPFPVETKLEVCAPFIPGNAEDSTLPVTMFRVTLKATAPGVEAVLISWLENATAPDSGDLFGGIRSFAGGGSPGLPDTLPPFVEFIARCDVKKHEGSSRQPIVFADFEGPDYGAWKAEGEAFGTGPSHGTEPNQNPVTGFQGKGLVNTYRPTDDVTGKLISPTFKIERRFINFLIGGGKSKETALRLVIDGNIAASASGKDNEHLDWAFFDCEKWQGKDATLQIVDEAKGGWGHVNVDQIEFSDEPRAGNGGPFETQPDVGTMHWIAFNNAHASRILYHSIQEGDLEALALVADENAHQRESNAPEGKSTAAWVARPNHPVAGLTQFTRLPSDAVESFDFALVWHHPNAEHGHGYSARFADAKALVDYVVKEQPRLLATTRAWHDAYYGGSLPHWLLERLHMPVSNLQTNVTQVWKSGRFWAWEGVGCCEGTCTHVWNYEHATGRLFPSLARSTREMQDLGAGFHEDGLVGYRGENVYAADGQCGTVLKCYREHLMSADDAFLKRNWPKIKKVVEYLLKRDGNDDGLIEDDQHNTYDIQFFGPNTFVGSLYLAALRAAEEMAKLVGEADFAARLHKVFELGSKQSVEQLWNGEYFVQKVDLKAHPSDQYADGCLSDQLFGQGWARQLGLGDLYRGDTVRQALRSVWKYCWAPDMGPQMAHHAPERYFARPGEAGLFVCTWPKSAHMGDKGIRYRDEVWTGIEYQVAGHMVWERMIEEALAIVRAIHERYDGRRHNPWNEVECGDHYARAMASVGVYLALLGFHLDAPAGVLRFWPVEDRHADWSADEFKAAIPLPDGFATVVQRAEGRQFSTEIRVAAGGFALNELRLLIPFSLKDWEDAGIELSSVEWSENGAQSHRIEAKLSPTSRLYSVRLASPLRLAPAGVLRVVVRRKA